MPLIFEIEQKPTFKTKTVFGVEIPVYGELTVDEAIAVEKAIYSELDRDNGLSNTESAKVQVAAWLSLRLGVPKAEINAQLNRSTALIDALWNVFYSEKQSDIQAYELDEVTEGKEEDPTIPLELSKTSKRSGTRSISSSQVADLQQNSLVILDNSVSA